MGDGLPDDWYIEHSGESRILDQRKVADGIERLRAAARDYLLEQTDERAAALAEALNLGNYILESTEVTDALSC